MGNALVPEKSPCSRGEERAGAKKNSQLGTKFISLLGFYKILRSKEWNKNKIHTGEPTGAILVPRFDYSISIFMELSGFSFLGIVTASTSTLKVSPARLLLKGHPSLKKSSSMLWKSSKPGLNRSALFLLKGIKLDMANNSLRFYFVSTLFR